MKVDKHAIAVLQGSSTFAAVAGILCLAVFLQDPSEPKNALLFGYSLPRLAGAALLGLGVLLTLATSASLWRQSARAGTLGGWVAATLGRLLGNRRSFHWISSSLLFLMFLMLSILLWQRDSPAFYLIYLERLEPLVGWLLLLQILFLGTIWSLRPRKDLALAAGELLQDALAAAAVYFIVAYLSAVSARIHYPFELEWVEGGMLSTVERVRTGLPIYQAPTLGYAPFIYPPLYYYLAAGLAQLLGSSFLSLRLVSFLCSLGTAWLLFALLRRETGRADLGLLGTGLFAAGYAASGAWYDLARVDSLMLLLTLAAYYVLRFHSGRRGELLAGVLIVLACLAKQHALLFIPPLGLAAWQARRGGLFLASSGVLLAATLLLLDWQNTGWLSFYTLQVPALHSLVPGKLGGFWLQEGLLLLLSVFSLLVFFSVFFSRLPSPGRYFVLYFFLAAIANAWGSSLSNGSFHNHLIPLVAAIAIAAPLSLAWLPKVLGPRAPNLVPTALLLVLSQFAFLHYNVLQVFPTPQDRQAGEGLVEFIAGVEGEVFIPRHPYLAGMAGKTESAHLAAFGEVLGFYGGPGIDTGEAIWEEINAAIRSQRFSLILLDTRGWMLRTFPEISEYYYFSEMGLYPDSLAFRPVSGLPTRPQIPYLPKPLP